ncbi:CBS domain-containing protein [Dissulfurirhabdus thermomarina]|uniref:CBS domain-containing protein n=1 Tax=Dissulfurirhabdus thermomarina TaxID=1765737 RepID=A0A6N9TT25_DISTH|nr:CBS and ACT domain-containing protein [Dissulfurirhabdus thermomarina]NDY43233.1 CBS domain-containing protein [Dissulfurirhabdus thermomarina]NMX23023.1 CBS domain-containing protein [Dissulfurirhabdus thermomarina]
MLVKEWMATKPITVEENTSIMKATQLMKEHGIRRIPVVRKNKLVGIVSDRDVKEAAPSKATSLDVHELYYLLSEIKVKDIMTPDPITLRENDSVEKAAVIMLENKISGLPVVNDKMQVTGIITQSDIFKVMIGITGIYRGPIQLGFDLEDRPGALNDLLGVLGAHEARTVSISSCQEHGGPGRRQVYVRIRDMDDADLEKLVASLKKDFRVLYVLREDVSDIPRKTPKASS